jgi:site-specific recombinase XerC
MKDGSRKKKRSKYQYVVREWLQEQKSALKSGYHSQDSNVRFSVFLDHYVKDIAGPTVKPKTLDSYQWLIESHVKPHLGDIPISKIDQRDIQDLMTLKLEEGLSKRSVQHMHAVIRKVLNEAVKEGLIIRNPASLVSAPTPEKKPLRTLTKEQANLFLESVKDHRWYPIYALAITTGMR